MKNKTKLRSAKIALLVLCGAIALAAILHYAPAITGPKKIKVLAMGVCPPWKPMGQEACKKSVGEVTAALKERLKLQDEDITILLDKDATYAGVENTLTQFSEHTSDNTTSILYFNTHGGIYNVEGAKDAPHKAHEMLVLWTEEKPFSIAEAVEGKEWILVNEMRKKLEAIKGKKILIFDACESGEIDQDLLGDMDQEHRAAAKESIIMSARADQYAMFAKEKDMALFSKKLVEAIRNPEHKNFLEAYNEAKERTETIAMDIGKKLPRNACTPSALCEQQPQEDDPDHLFEELQF